MKKSILRIITSLILFVGVSNLNVFAMLSMELKIFYTVESLSRKIFIIEFILLIIMKMRKKDINIKFAIIYILWFIFLIIAVDKNSSYLLSSIYAITIIIGITMIVYTLKKIFERRNLICQK